LASAAPTASASPPAAGATGAPSLEPALLDAEGKPLPQTDERPRVDGAAFKQRIELLAEAIINDDPARARPAFFPVVAYEQVKAVAKPARDWEYRLVRAFEKNIHEYHRALGADAARAKFVGITVNEAAARFMKPGSEGNRLGYYRVLRSRLGFERADGKRQDFELTSLISWRGEWYVVHLHGFE